MHADPERAKKTVKLSSFFALSGSARVKAARRMLMKLTPVLLSHNCQVLFFGYFLFTSHRSTANMKAVSINMDCH